MEKKGRKTIKPEKLKEVEDLANSISSYGVIGMLNLYKTPASALQKIKTYFRGKAVIKVSKKSILLRALDKSGKQNLKEFVVGYPALILTNMDSFLVYNSLRKRCIT